MKLKRKKCHKGTIIPNVIYLTNNIIVQFLKLGNPSKVVIIGTGNYVGVKWTEKNKLQITNSKGMKYIPYNLANYFKNESVYLIYLNRECQGLDFACQDIEKWVSNIIDVHENWINSDKSFKNVKLDVDLVGFSKTATCFLKVASNLDDNRITLYTIAAPINGTILSSPDIYQQEKHCNLIFNFIHKNVFSGLKVESDIAPNTDFIRSLKGIKEKSQKIKSDNTIWLDTSHESALCKALSYIYS